MYSYQFCNLFNKYFDLNTDYAKINEKKMVCCHGTHNIKTRQMK